MTLLGFPSSRVLQVPVMGRSDTLWLRTRQSPCGKGTITVANRTYAITQAAASSAYTCTGSANPKNVRAGGIAELASSITLACSGAVPTGGIRADVLLVLNTTTGSRIIGPDTTEAVLFINAPATPVVGINAFVAQLGGFNELRFKDVPIGTPGQALTLRIENIRVMPPGLWRLQDNGVGGNEVVIHCGCETGPAGGWHCMAGATAGTQSSISGPGPTMQTLPLVFAEGFENAYKLKIAPGQQQSTIGTEYNSESGYIHPNLGMLNRRPRSSHAIANENVGHPRRCSSLCACECS